MKYHLFLSNQGVISGLVWNDNNNAVLLDPGFDLAQDIVKFIKKNDLKIEYLLETHTHADFFSAKVLFKNLYPEIKIGLSELAETKLNEINLRDNDKIDMKNFHIKATYSPGHTEDSMCYVVENGESKHIFTGDTMLIGGTGRTDFQGGSSETLYQSLKKLSEYPDDTVVIPAHNYKNQKETTLGLERETNKRFKLVIDGKKEEFLDLMDNHKPDLPDLFQESLKWNSRF